MANDHTLSLKNEKYLARNLSPVCIEMFGDDDHYILLLRFKMKNHRQNKTQIPSQNKMLQQILNRSQ